MAPQRGRAVHDARSERRTAIEGWFDIPASELLDHPSSPAAVRPAPPRWKQAVSIWLGFFPTNLVFSLLPAWGTVPRALRVLVTTVVLTPVLTYAVLTYAVLPFVTARLRPWLERSPARPTGS